MLFTIMIKEIKFEVQQPKVNKSKSSISKYYLKKIQIKQISETSELSYQK